MKCVQAQTDREMWQAQQGKGSHEFSCQLTFCICTEAVLGIMWVTDNVAIAPG